MTSTPVFRVGETPIRPLGILVEDVTDLNDYDSITIEGSTAGFPDGFVDIDQDNPQLVLYTFSGPFEEAGHFEGTVLLHKDGASDFTTDFWFDVQDSLPVTLITPTDVYSITSQYVSQRDIVRSQALIALRVDRDLTNEEWLDTISSADLRRLKAAIAWSALVPEQSYSDYAERSIKSASSGSVSVTYSDDGYNSALGLHPITETLISQLTFLQGPKTLFNSLSIDRQNIPTYTNETAFYSPINYNASPPNYWD